MRARRPPCCLDFSKCRQPCFADWRRILCPLRLAPHSMHETPPRERRFRLVFRCFQEPQVQERAGSVEWFERWRLCPRLLYHPLSSMLERGTGSRSAGLSPPHRISIPSQIPRTLLPTAYPVVEPILKFPRHCTNWTKRASVANGPPFQTYQSSLRQHAEKVNSDRPIRDASTPTRSTAPTIDRIHGHLFPVWLRHNTCGCARAIQTEAVRFLAFLPFHVEARLPCLKFSMTQTQSEGF